MIRISMARVKDKSVSFFFMFFAAVSKIRPLEAWAKIRL
jgi:hypothetical protein